MSFQIPPRLSVVSRDRGVQVALLLALVLRLLLAGLPQVPHLTGDSSSYMDPGKNLFSHASFAMTCDPRCIPTLWRTPGYPVIVGLFVGLLHMPTAVVYAFQALCDTFTTLLVATIGWAAGGRRAGIAAATIHGLNPFTAVFAAQIMTESVISLVSMSAIYLLWRLSRSEGREDRKSLWIGLGLLLGFATLVRPVFAPLPVFLAVVVFDRTRWREQAYGWSLAIAAFALVLAPWVARNWAVTRGPGADDSFKVLASFSSPFYRRIVTPGVMRWYRTYEEPFVWDRPREPPAVAHYFLPGEQERLERLFEDIRQADVQVTPEIDAGFDELARERVQSHPIRTTILPPLTRWVRLWITPRLSSMGIESARLHGSGGRLLLLAATGYNAMFPIVGFTTGFLLLRRSMTRLLLAVPVFLTLIHSFLMFGNQSRYTVPGLPEMAILTALGGVLLLDRIRQSSRLLPQST